MLLHLAEKNQDQGFVEMWCVRIQLWSFANIVSLEMASERFLKMLKVTILKTFLRTTS